MLKVLEGNKIANEQKKKTPIWWGRKYLDMALRHIIAYQETEDRYSLMAYCLCSVRALNYQMKAGGYLVEDAFRSASTIKDVLSLLTPIEFLRTFPPAKTYSGERYECVDYFSSVKKFEGMLMNEPIEGNCTDILEILSGYDNVDIMDLNVNATMLVSRLMKLITGKDLFDSFLESQGKPPLKKYYMHTDENGHQYVVDEDGNAQRVHKRKPRYLQVVKT